MQQLHPHQIIYTCTILRQYGCQIPKRNRPPLLQSLPIALNLLRDPTRIRHHARDSNHHQRRELPTDQKYQSENGNSLHVEPRPRQELEAGAVEEAGVDSFGERAVVFVIEFGLEGPAGHEVGVDGFEAILVELQIRFAQSKDVRWEERLTGLAFGGV